MAAPENFIIPSQYGNQNQGTAKAYVGQSGGRPFRFFTIQQRNHRKSEEQQIEVNDTIEMVEFLNDEKCKPTRRIDPSIFNDHPEILGEYQKWKDGVVSGITEIRDWDALSYGEIGMLISRGYFSVEQIVDSPIEQLMSLGMMYKDILNKAKLHMATKNKAKGILTENEELSKLKIDLQKSSARDAEREAEMAKMREQLEALMAAGVHKTETKKPVTKKVAGVQS